MCIRDRPVHTADDLANMKIRVQSSPMMLGLVEGLGGFPQAIASTELYSALQTGVVDGAENNINTYNGDSLYEQAPYFIYDHHNIQPEIIVASKQTWDLSLIHISSVRRHREIRRCDGMR